MISMDSYKHSS